MVDWSGGPHVARPELQRWPGYGGPGGLRSLQLLLQGVLCTVLSPSLPVLPPKPFLLSADPQVLSVPEASVPVGQTGFLQPQAPPLSEESIS